MFEDRVILVENMDIDKAKRLINTLPNRTNKKNRHKFVFTNNKEMIISKSGKSNPRQGILGNPKIDKMAGYISFTIDEDGEVTHVYMNNQSKDFNYPKFEKLKEPQVFITKIFGPICVDMEEIPKPRNKIIDLSNLTTH